MAIDGRLEWREWEDKNGKKRQSVEIVAERVQFVGGRGASNTPPGARGEVPGDTPGLAGVAAEPHSPEDDDIPF